MNRILRSGLVLSLFFLLSAVRIAHAERIAADLIGYEEVPSVSTVASGDFRAFINHDDQSIDYELSYSGLQGTVQQAHIHVAQLSVNGSIVIWLCQTTTTQAPDAVRLLTPFCPSSGTVTGHITAANVIAGSTTTQQLSAAAEMRGRQRRSSNAGSSDIAIAA